MKTTVLNNPRFEEAPNPVIIVIAVYPVYTQITHWAAHSMTAGMRVLPDFTLGSPSVVLESP